MGCNSSKGITKVYQPVDKQKTKHDKPLWHYHDFDSNTESMINTTVTYVEPNTGVTSSALSLKRTCGETCSDNVASDTPVLDTATEEQMITNKVSIVNQIDR